MKALVADWYIEERCGSWMIFDERRRLMGSAPTLDRAEVLMAELMP